jgi:hypothetical protein
MTDLVLTGTFKIGATDCSAEVTGVIIKTLTKDVVVPATLTKPTSHAGGANRYELQLDYLSDDATSGIIFPLLWGAMSSATGELSFTVLLRAGAIGVGNPQWAGTIAVSAADVGALEEELSTGTSTHTMTGAPVVTTS